jgi:sugar-specific transcriptional regulator TrmB
MDLIEQILTSFSLTEKEKNIFHILLDNGTLTASQAARLCELPRNTVRGVLDKLTQTGLVFRSKKANTNYYAVEEKEAIIKSLKRQKELISATLDSQIELIEESAELLKRNSVSKKKPTITYYDGYKGLRKVYEDSLTATETIRAWASFDANAEAMPNYFPNYYKRRAAKGIAIRSIHPDTPAARKGTTFNKNFLRECVLIPKEKFLINPEIQIYNDKVTIVSWKEKFALIIKSEEISSALRAIFDLCYSTSSNVFTEK